VVKTCDPSRRQRYCLYGPCSAPGVSG
jgi:hypothetical protein